MTNLPTYPWFDQAPDHLKTRRQLADLGLRPGGPVVAQVVWRKGKAHADLYDQTTAKPKRAMTAAQAAALEKARAAQRTCPNCKTVFDFTLPWRFDPWRDCPVCVQASRAHDRADAIRMARVWLQSPRTVILDTETTDLDGYLVQIAVIRAHDGAVLLDTLINPQTEISAGAYRVHGISAEGVATAPTFDQIADRLFTLLRGRRIVTYNAAFDRGIIANEVERVRQSTSARRLLMPRRWRCAMELRAAYIGDWSDYHEDYRWYPLDGGDHSALGDAIACRKILMEMSELTD